MKKHRDVKLSHFGIITNMIQNIVHVILGLAILMSVMKSKAMLLKIVGIIFAIVGILGFAMSGDTVLGIVVDSTATNSLHLILGVVILLIAFMNKGGSSHSAPTDGGGMSGGMNNPQTPPQQPNNPQM